MARKGEFWLGMIVGAAAGAVGALLYAPKSGPETRREIRHAAREAGRKAGAAWGDVKERTSEMACDVQEGMQQAADKSRHAMEDIGARMRKAVKAGRRASEEKLDELQANYEESKRKGSRKAA